MAFFQRPHSRRASSEHLRRGSSDTALADSSRPLSIASASQLMLPGASTSTHPSLYSPLGSVSVIDPCASQHSLSSQEGSRAASTNSTGHPPQPSTLGLFSIKSLRSKFGRKPKSSLYAAPLNQRHHSSPTAVAVPAPPRSPLQTSHAFQMAHTAAGLGTPSHSNTYTAGGSGPRIVRVGSLQEWERVGGLGEARGIQDVLSVTIPASCSWRDLESAPSLLRQGSAGYQIPASPKAPPASVIPRPMSPIISPYANRTPYHMTPGQFPQLGPPSQTTPTTPGATTISSESSPSMSISLPPSPIASFRTHPIEAIDHAAFPTSQTLPSLKLQDIISSREPSVPHLTPTSASLKTSHDGTTVPPKTPTRIASLSHSGRSPLASPAASSSNISQLSLPTEDNSPPQSETTQNLIPPLLPQTDLAFEIPTARSADEPHSPMTPTILTTPPDEGTLIMDKPTIHDQHREVTAPLGTSVDIQTSQAFEFEDVDPSRSSLILTKPDTRDFIISASSDAPVDEDTKSLSGVLPSTEGGGEPVTSYAKGDTLTDERAVDPPNPVSSAQEGRRPTSAQEVGLKTPELPMRALGNGVHSVGYFTPMQGSFADISSGETPQRFTLVTSQNGQSGNPESDETFFAESATRSTRSDIDDEAQFASEAVSTEVGSSSRSGAVDTSSLLGLSLASAKRGLSSPLSLLMQEMGTTTVHGSSIMAQVGASDSEHVHEAPIADEASELQLSTLCESAETFANDTGPESESELSVHAYGMSSDTSSQLSVPGMVNSLEASDILTTPRASKRWSLDELEQAYGRMKDMIGSRSLSVSISSIPPPLEEEAAIAEDLEKSLEYQRISQKMYLSGIDFDKVDGDLKKLLSPYNVPDTQLKSGNVPSTPSSPESFVSRKPREKFATSTPPQDGDGNEVKSQAITSGIRKPLAGRRTTVQEAFGLDDRSQSSRLHQHLTAPEIPSQIPSPRRGRTGTSVDLRATGRRDASATGISRAYTADNISTKSGYSASTTPEPGWQTPMSAVSPRRSDSIATSPNAAAARRLRPSLGSPAALSMRSAAGRQWANGHHGELDHEARTQREASASSSDAGSATGSSSKQRSDATLSTLTSNSRWTGHSNSPSPSSSTFPQAPFFPRTTSAGSVAGDRPPPASFPGKSSSSVVHSRNESWYDEDTPRKATSLGRSTLVPRWCQQHRRDVSDFETASSVAGSTTSGLSMMMQGHISDARSMNKIDLFLLASKLQAELETTQKQAAIEREALLDALRESREVVSDLRVERNDLQASQSMKVLIEERDVWRRRAEEVSRTVREQHGSLEEAKSREEDYVIQVGRLERRVAMLSNELKRAVVDLRSASSVSSSMGRVKKSSVVSDRNSGTSVGRRFEKERTPSTGPLMGEAELLETPVNATTFRFASPSGVTPHAIRSQRTRSQSSSCNDDHHDDRVGSPASTVFADHQSPSSHRHSIGSVGHVLELSPEDELFLQDLDEGALSGVEGLSSVDGSDLQRRT